MKVFAHTHPPTHTHTHTHRHTQTHTHTATRTRTNTHAVALTHTCMPARAHAHMHAHVLREREREREGIERGRWSRVYYLRREGGSAREGEGGWGERERESMRGRQIYLKYGAPPLQRISGPVMAICTIIRPIHVFYCISAELGRPRCAFSCIGVTLALGEEEPLAMGEVAGGTSAPVAQFARPYCIGIVSRVPQVREN
jgi:hypothetical protein